MFTHNHSYIGWLSLDFPGDMTTYGIRFTDENNNVHVYQIYQSLRNGTLVMQED